MILGHMIQGEWIEPNGETAMEVSVYFDLLRLWDSRAVWWKMETDLTALIDNISFAQNRGAKVMFTFGEPPASAVMGGYSKVPTMEAWEAFIRRVIGEAQGRIDVYEGWNEPGIPPYWDGSPELLVEFERRRFLLTKELAPQSIVLSPSFTEPALARGREFITRYVAAGGLDLCDGVAFHGYAAKPEDLAGDIVALRKLVGSEVPLWNTEYVIAPVSLADRPKAMADSLMLQAQMGIRCAVWNAEIPGSEDYTDSTMQRVHDQLAQRPKIRRGCLLSFLGV